LVLAAPPGDALDSVYKRTGDDAWIEEWEAPDGDMLIRGTMTLAGDRLTVEANSDIRADRLVETLLRLLPDAEVVVDERQDPPKIRRGGPGRPDDDEPVPPELEEALDEWRRRHEEMWIDESIPALGGLTPRQALDDPSRREDLLALLREEDREGGTGYSASRIRSLLGLA
jgi:hypothetical protein